MFFRRFFFVAFFGLLLIIGFSAMRHQSGFAQGYAQGYAAAAQEIAGESAAETSAPETHARSGWGSFPPYGASSLFAMLFKFFLVFAAISFFMKLLFSGRHHHRYGHQSGGWGRHEHCGKWGSAHGHHHGAKNPQKRKPQKGDPDYEKQPEDVEPDIRSY